MSNDIQERKLALMAKLEAALRSTMNDADTRQRMAAAGAEPTFETAGALAARMPADVRKFADAMTKAHLEAQ